MQPKAPGGRDGMPLDLPAYDLTTLPADKIGCRNASASCARHGLDLVCSSGGHEAILHGRTRRVGPVVVSSRNFFGRIAYHLFESIYGTLFASYASIETSELVAAPLYRRALHAVPQAARPAAFATRLRVQVRSE